MKFTVTEKAMRPASPSRRCFYCQSAVGKNHRTDCILISRPIKIAIEIPLDVPVNYTDEEIDYWFEEGNGRQCIAKFFENDDWIADNLYVITGSWGEPFLDEK